MTIADVFEGIHVRHRPLRRLRVPRATPLAQLKIVAIDTETTGLDPRRDRLVAIAGIRLRGLTTGPHRSLDLTINPGVPIPPRASAVHGIHDSDVADQRRFVDAYPAIRAMIEESIIVGHHVSFDLALLAAEARRHGLPWREPLHLDTARMVAALAPQRRRLDLADLLRSFGLEPIGRRHRAADDAAMAASLYGVLARHLIAHGRGTLAGALALG